VPQPNSFSSLQPNGAVMDGLLRRKQAGHGSLKRNVQCFLPRRDSWIPGSMEYGSSGFRRPGCDAAVSLSQEISLTVATSLHSSAEVHDVVNSLEDTLWQTAIQLKMRLASRYERCHEDPLRLEVTVRASHDRRVGRDATLALSLSTAHFSWLAAALNVA